MDYEKFRHSTNKIPFFSRTLDYAMVNSTLVLFRIYMTVSNTMCFTTSMLNYILNNFRPPSLPSFFLLLFYSFIILFFKLSSPLYFYSFLLAYLLSCFFLSRFLFFFLALFFSFPLPFFFIPA